MGFPTKNDHFGVFWEYHHLRKHPNLFCTNWNFPMQTARSVPLWVIVGEALRVLGLVESRVAGVASWPCLFHSVYVYPRNITFWTQKWRFGRCISFSNSMLVFGGEGNSTTKLFVSWGVLISHSSNQKVECHVRVLNAAHIGIQTSRWIISFKIEVCHFSKAIKCHVFSKFGKNTGCRCVLVGLELFPGFQLCKSVARYLESCMSWFWSNYADVRRPHPKR